MSPPRKEDRKPCKFPSSVRRGFGGGANSLRGRHPVLRGCNPLHLIDLASCGEKNWNAPKLVQMFEGSPQKSPQFGQGERTHRWLGSAGYKAFPVSAGMG